MLDRLRELRDAQREMQASIREVKEGQTAIRHMPVAMQSDDLRQEASIAALRSDVDTIKSHLTRAHA